MKWFKKKEDTRMVLWNGRADVEDLVRGLAWELGLEPLEENGIISFKKKTIEWQVGNKTIYKHHDT